MRELSVRVLNHDFRLPAVKKLLDLCNCVGYGWYKLWRIHLKYLNEQAKTLRSRANCDSTANEFTSRTASLDLVA